MPISPHIPAIAPRPAWSRYRPATSFIGRERELAAVTALIDEGEARLVTLLGPGGVGKTRLSLHLLEQLETTHPTIEGTFVPLAALSDPSHVVPAIARALNVEEQGTRPLDALIAQQIAASARRHLLVLDNTEQIMAGMDVLPDLIAACPNLVVLVTSRTVLRFSAERIVPIDPLVTRPSTLTTGDDPMSPAAALFVERARAVRPDLALDDTPENLAAIEDICAQLDGLPLAIELAAARSRFFTPPALLRRIADRLQVLTDGPRDAPERHRTLRALLTWSHDLLDADARILFRRLGIFAGGASFGAVEAICNAGGDLDAGTDPLIAQLVDQSLIRIDQDTNDEPRIRMLQTIRDYSLEQLAFSGETPKLRRAHAAWFVGLTRDIPFSAWSTGTPESEVLTRRYYPDQANFLAALEYLLAESPQDAVQLALGLCVFWLEIGQLREGYARLSRVLPHASPDAWQTRSTLLRIAALMASENGQHALALDHIREAHDLAIANGSPRLQAIVFAVLAGATWESGDEATGERMLRDSIDQARAIGDPVLVASFQASLGDGLLNRGRFDDARPFIEEGVRVLQEAGHASAALYVAAVAAIALHEGDYERAADNLRLSLDYHSRPPYRQPLGRAYRFIGIAELALERGHPEAAARLLGAAERIYDQIGGPGQIVDVFGYPALSDRVDAALGHTTAQDFRRDGRHWSTPEALQEAIAATWLEPASMLPPRPRQTSGSPAASIRDAAFDGLTARERDILDHLAQGKTNEAIAETLFISPRTVTTHVTRIYAKLGVSNRAEAVAFAIAHGFTDRGAAA
ncbi:MAG: LuxR C-terminal-related transcriptional regulator [Thermomicrobiales bacterium]